MRKHRIGDIIVYKTPYYADLKFAIITDLTKSGNPQILDEAGYLHSPRSTIVNVSIELEKMGLKIVKDE